MPSSILVGTMAIGKPGAIYAALFAAAILSLEYEAYRARLDKHRKKQAQAILEVAHPAG